LASYHPNVKSARRSQTSPRWRAKNKSAEMLAYLLAPLVLPLVCAAVLWGLMIERPQRT
jgi:hypothetical protein